MNALDLTVIEQRRKSPGRKDSLLLALITSSVALALLIGGQTVWSGMTEGYCVIWPGIGTAFTPDFSHRGFARIQPGMTPAQVEALIGSPMSKGGGRGAPSGWPAYQPGDVTWSYSHDSSKIGGDWAWLAREVVFRDGRVMQAVRWTYHD